MIFLTEEKKGELISQAKKGANYKDISKGKNKSDSVIDNLAPEKFE